MLFFFKIILFFLVLLPLLCVWQNTTYKAFGVLPQHVNDSLLEYYKRATNAEDKLIVLNKIGQNYIKRGITDSVVFYGKKIKTLVSSLKDTQLDTLYYNKQSQLLIAKGYLLEGDLDKAQQLVLSSIKSLKNTSNASLGIPFHLILAKIYLT